MSRHRAMKGTPTTQGTGVGQDHRAATKHQPSLSLPRELPTLHRPHLRSAVPLPRTPRLFSAPAARLPSTGGLLSSGPALSPITFLGEKTGSGAGAGQVGPGSRGVPGEPLTAPHRAGGAAELRAGRGLERGGGRGAAPWPEGGAEPPWRAETGWGGFASVRELRAGGTDGGTGGRRHRRTEAARGEAPARCARPPRCPMELCPGPAPPSGWALPLLLALGAAGLSHGTPHLPYSRPGSRSK